MISKQPIRIVDRMLIFVYENRVNTSTSGFPPSLNKRFLQQATQILIHCILFHEIFDNTMAFPRQISAEELQRSLHSAADRLGINDFHPQQRSALEAFLRGHDVFVNLPTGFGKSLIFQAAPFCWDFLRQSAGSIAIVISPLTALMHDQLNSLKRKGISAACLTRDTTPETKSAINKGQFSLVYASPEAMSVSARALLSTDVYKKNLCGIFVDESHCIKKW